MVKKIDQLLAEAFECRAFNHDWDNPDAERHPSLRPQGDKDVCRRCGTIREVHHETGYRFNYTGAP